MVYGTSSLSNILQVGIPAAQCSHRTHEDLKSTKHTFLWTETLSVLGPCEHSLRTNQLWMWLPALSPLYCTACQRQRCCSIMRRTKTERRETTKQRKQSKRKREFIEWKTGRQTWGHQNWRQHFPPGEAASMVAVPRWHSSWNTVLFARWRTNEIDEGNNSAQIIKAILQ